MDASIVGILIHLLVTAVLLMAAMAVAGGDAKRRNTPGRAFGAAAALSLLSTLFMAIGSTLLLILQPFIALAILKGIYAIGWLRALLVSFVLFVIWVLAVIFIYAPLSLISSGFSAVFGLS